MAAVSLRDESVPDLFLTEFAKTPRSITDFLGTEVLERQPAEILDFLLATSILDVLDPQSCAAVTDDYDASTVLNLVDDRHLFLIELARDTYRYHHLFADLLRHRLHADDPDREQALHRRAAASFVETGDIENAFVHLLKAGQETDAFELLRSSLIGVFVQGDGRALHRLAAKVGTETATGEPGRLADLALALAASAPADQATPWIIRANSRADDFNDADRARLVLARGLVAAQYGEADQVEQALSDYAAPKDFPDDEVAQYGPTLLARTRLWIGDLNGAREICEQTLDPLAEPSMQQIAISGALAWVACIEGLLTEAERLAKQALQGAETIRMAAHTAMVDAIRTQGRVAFERGDLVSAERLLEQSVSISEDVRPRVRAREPAVALASLARRRPSRRGTLRRRTSANVPAAGLHQSVAQPLSRVGRPDLDRDWRPQPRHPVRGSASSPEIEPPCFRLGSSLPEASSIAPTTRSFDASR